MKKYILISFVAALFFTGCVKDEQPAPLPPAPENFSDIVINELIAKDTTNPYFIDDAGNPADWVELYNKGNKVVDIAGMYITDAPGDDTKYQEIPSGNSNVTTIPPKGFLVLICNAADSGGTDLPTQIKDGKIFIDMGLSSSKDNNVAIYTPEKTEVDISGDFNGLEDDKSFGRLPDGTGGWEVLTSKTPGVSNDNTAPIVGDLVINEFMVSNDTTLVPGVDNDFPDWIEIYNTGDIPIDMGGWYVTDDLSDSVKYQLPVDDPDLTTVPGHGYLLLICDGLGEGLHTNFKLSSGGESVGISMDGITIKEGYTYCDTGCDLPNPPTDFSTGRDGDGAATWKIFDPGTSSPPTPGASNN